MIKIEFETTPTDAKTYFESFIKNNRIMQLFPMVWAGLLTVSIGRIIWQSSGNLMLMIAAGLVIGLLAYIGVFWVIRFITNRISTGITTRMREDGAFGRTTFTLQPTNLHRKMKKDSASFEYEKVGRIIETDQHVAINLDGTFTTIIPKDQILANDLDAFLAQLKVNKHRPNFQSSS